MYEIQPSGIYQKAHYRTCSQAAYQNGRFCTWRNHFNFQANVKLKTDGGRWSTASKTKAAATAPNHRARPANRGQKQPKQGGLLHKWYRNRYNTKKHTQYKLYITVVYDSNVRPAIAFTSQVIPVCELNLMELGQVLGWSCCFDDVSAWPAFFILSENPFFISLKYSPPIASAAGQAWTA